MTEREAITTLAALVARLANGCWADLGTDESRDIAQHADSVFKAMLERPGPTRLNAVRATQREEGDGGPVNS